MKAIVSMFWSINLISISSTTFPTDLLLSLWPWRAADEQNEHCIGQPRVVMIVATFVVMFKILYFSIGKRWNAGKGSSSRSSITGLSGVTISEPSFSSWNASPWTFAKSILFSTDCTSSRKVYSPSPLTTTSTLGSFKTLSYSKVGWYPPKTIIVSGLTCFILSAESRATPMVGVRALIDTISGFRFKISSPISS